MKTARKVLVLALCAILLVSATIMGTMAYLTTKTNEVKNTFTIGNVSFATQGLDEADVDEYGNLLYEVDPDTNEKVLAARVVENEYKLVPGHTYTKDPTVHTGADSEDCYLFVKVENAIEDLEAEGNTSIAAQILAHGWKLVTTQTDGAKIYIYAGTDLPDADSNATKAPVAGGENKVVFESFTLADDADEQFDNVTTGTNGDAIKITAYAIQVDGFEGTEWTAEAIWAETGYAETVTD